MGLLSAIIDAIHGEDELIGGQPITKLTATLSSTETTTMTVESTLRIGEQTDGDGDALLLVDGEVISATGRTSATGNMTFTTLTRGVDSSDVKTHPVGTLVYDLSRNTSALDLVRRGLFSNFAVGEDLNIIGRNLGLERCAGIDEEAWRRIIQAVAYLPKNTTQAVDAALEAFFGNTANHDVIERLISDPHKVFVEVTQQLQSGVDQYRGLFNLSGGEPQLTTGALSVDTTYPIRQVLGVYDSTVNSRRGYRETLTDYFVGGSFVTGSTTITLGSTPGGAGTAVLVDYFGYGADVTTSYHYLADDENVTDDNDRYAYFSDPTAAIRCLLDQVRPIGKGIEIIIRS